MKVVLKKKSSSSILDVGIERNNPQIGSLIYLQSCIGKILVLDKIVLCTLYFSFENQKPLSVPLFYKYKLRIQTGTLSEQLAC